MFPTDGALILKPCPCVIQTLTAPGPSSEYKYIQVNLWYAFFQHHCEDLHFWLCVLFSHLVIYKDGIFYASHHTIHSLKQKLASSPEIRQILKMMILRTSKGGICYCSSSLDGSGRSSNLSDMLPSNHKPAAIGSVTPLIFVTRIIFQNNIFKKVTTRPDIAHPFGNSPTQLWKGSLCSLLVKVQGCFPKMCWNNLRTPRLFSYIIPFPARKSMLVIMGDIDVPQNPKREAKPLGSQLYSFIQALRKDVKQKPKRCLI